MGDVRSTEIIDTTACINVRLSIEQLGTEGTGAGLQ
jgi:hypothetical protein